MSVALSVSGKVQHGVLINPMLREEFTASRGTAAQVNTQRLRVSKNTTLDNGLVTLGTDAANEGRNALLLGLQKSL